MLAENMKALLDQIIEAKYTENCLYYEDPQRPRANGPASDGICGDSIRFSQQRDCKRRPATERSVYNGIQNALGPDYSLLSIDEIGDGKYKMMSENIEEFPTLCEFLIAAGDTLNFFGFDFATPARGKGYELVEISADGREWRLESFENFLTTLLAVMEQRIAAKQKDRESPDAES